MTGIMTSRDHPCYIHIGLQKTGTSYLQSILWNSRRQLRRQGLQMLPHTKLQSYHAMLATRGLLREGVEPPSAFTALDRLAEQAAAVTTPRALVTQESLAPASTDQARGLLDRLPGLEPHLVITVRDLARQIPSGWQLLVRTGATRSYDDFLRQLVDRGPASRRFWINQDLPAVVKRWEKLVPAERIHVVTVPPPGGPRELLLERFCSVVDVDPGALRTGRPTANSSIGVVQAELLRRVNLELGDRLGNRRRYGDTVKRVFGGEILASQTGPRDKAPAELAEWCRSVAEEHVAFLRSGGYPIVGDLADLVPSPESFAPREDAVPPEVLTSSAVTAIADLLERQSRMKERSKQLRARVRSQEQELQEVRGRRVGARYRAARGKARRAAGKVRARLRTP